MVTTPVLLEMRNITKSFGEAEVLKGVNFSLNAGEVHAMLGENGAGKSTLMKILSGVYVPNHGDVYINGVKRERYSAQESKREGVAIVYQDLSLVPELTVASNIFLGREVNRGGILDNKRIYKLTEDLINEYNFPLDPWAQTGMLSFAQQQMVEIVKALSQNAQIIVMDEPTSSLTSEEEDVLFGIIRKLRGRKKGIIYISHRMEEVMKIADTITVIRDGVNRRVLKKEEADLHVLIELITGKEDTAKEEEKSKTIIESSCNGEVLLAVDHLKMAYGVKDASFSLHSGEILGVSGLIGSGRSSLAKALFGLERITGGTMYLSGQPYHPKGAIDAIDSGIALIPEERRRQALFSELSVEYNLTVTSIGRLSKSPLMRWLSVVNGNATRSIAQGQISRLNVACKGLFQWAGELSGGTQQKLILGRWLSTQPKIFILDEATMGVDIGTKKDIWALMNEMASNGLGILYISSDLSELVGISHRVAVMVDGVLSHMEGRVDERAIRLRCQSEHAKIKEMSM